jgi:hypothetical protein
MKKIAREQKAPRLSPAGLLQLPHQPSHQRIAGG